MTYLVHDLKHGAFEQVGGVWVLRFKHGMPVDEDGNVLDEHLYY